MLRLDLSEPTSIAWSDDCWVTTRMSLTTDIGAGMHVVELPSHAGPGGQIAFRLNNTEHLVAIV